MAGGRGRGRNGGMPPGTTQDDETMKTIQDDANDLGDEDEDNDTRRRNDLGDEDDDEDNDTRRRERIRRTNKQVPNYQQTTVAHEQ